MTHEDRASKLAVVGLNLGRWVVRYLAQYIIGLLGPVGVLIGVGLLLALIVVNGLSGSLMMADSEPALAQGTDTPKDIYAPVVDDLVESYPEALEGIAQRWAPPWSLLAAMDLVSMVEPLNVGRYAEADAAHLAPQFTRDTFTITTQTRVIEDGTVIDTKEEEDQMTQITGVNAWDGLYTLRYDHQWSEWETVARETVKREQPDGTVMTMTRVTETRTQQLVRTDVFHATSFDRLASYARTRPVPIQKSDIEWVLRAMATQEGFPINFDARTPGAWGSTMPIRGPSSSTIDNVMRWRHMFVPVAQQHNVDPAFIAAVISVESTGNPNAVSRVGAMGLMQVMPFHFSSHQNGFDPRTNLRVGVAYLAAQLERFDDIPLAAAAYNAGPGAVEKYNGIPPYPETMRYVPAVLKAYRQFQDEGL